MARSSSSPPCWVGGCCAATAPGERSRGRRARSLRYRLLILDFDGTLADSRPWFTAAMAEVAQRFQLRRIDAAEAERLRDLDSQGVLQALGVPLWKVPAIARHLRRRAAEEAAGIPVFPGTHAMLRALSDRGVALALVSSNAEATVRRILGPESAARIGCYECGASLFGKAARFRAVLRRTGFAPAETLCLGDEARDIEAAAAAGLDCAAVGWGYNTAAMLAQRRPARLFHEMAEVVAYLGGAHPPAEEALES